MQCPITNLEVYYAIVLSLQRSIKVHYLYQSFNVVEKWIFYLYTIINSPYLEASYFNDLLTLFMKTLANHFNLYKHSIYLTSSVISYNMTIGFPHFQQVNRLITRSFYAYTQDVLILHSLSHKKAIKQQTNYLILNVSTYLG